MTGTARAEARVGHLSYQPALDGLRAIAVASVVVYHAGLGWGTGGFVGIDVFFVLSGYLITTLLLREHHATGTIDLLAFWARRARRLLPALLVTLSAVAVSAMAFGSAQQLARLRGDGFATLFYVSNWRFVLSGQSYFEAADPSPLRHTWSLAIEEQWYLVWPIVLLGALWLSRRRSGPVLVGVIVAAAGSAWLMSAWHDPGDPSRVYYGTDTRVQALLIGAAVALVLDRWTVTGRVLTGLRAAAVPALLGVGWAALTFDDGGALPYGGGLTAVALAAGVVIASCVGPAGGPVAHVLSWSLLRGLGKISYGVYLYHWPIFVVLTSSRTGLDGMALFAARVAVTLAVSIASYRWLELPVRDGRWFHGRRARPALAFAAAGVAVLFVLSGAVPVGDPSAAASGPSRSSTSASGPSERPDAEAVEASSVGAPTDGSTPVGPTDTTTVPAPAVLPDEVPPPAVVPPARVLLVGDSVAYTVAMYLDEHRIGGVPSYDWFTFIGCGILDGTPISAGRPHPMQDVDCTTWRSEWQRKVDQFDPEVSVVLLGAWEVFDTEVDGRIHEVGTAAFEQRLSDHLREGLDILTSGGGRVALMNVQCMDNVDAELKGGQDWERTEPDRIAEVNRIFAEVAAERPETVELLDLHGFLCPDGDYHERHDGVDVHYDGHHFTDEGASILWDWVLPQL